MRLESAVLMMVVGLCYRVVAWVCQPVVVVLVFLVLIVVVFPALLPGWVCVILLLWILLLVHSCQKLLVVRSSGMSVNSIGRCGCTVCSAAVVVFVG